MKSDFPNFLRGPAGKSVCSGSFQTLSGGELALEELAKLDTTQFQQTLVFARALLCQTEALLPYFVRQKLLLRTLTVSNLD